MYRKHHDKSIVTKQTDRERGREGEREEGEIFKMSLPAV